MSGRKNLVAFGNSDGAQSTPGDGDDAVAETAVTSTEAGSPDYMEAWQEEEAAKTGAGWLLPVAALLLIAAWTGFFGWVHSAQMFAGASPEVWAGWIGDWAIPVLLVIGIWLLAMRSSTREAKRFGDTARLLSAESSALETRLTTVNRELSLARDFIASQSRDLESLGRIASERLSGHADHLQSLIRDNGAQVSAIGEVSDRALANMDQLRSHLPVIANSARDVTNQIGSAGNTAQSQLEDMVAGFARLNEFGEASAQHVEVLRAKVDETLSGFELHTTALDDLTQKRFAALHQQNEDFRLELEARETDTLAAIRRRADELGHELAGLAQQSREREDAAIADLHDRLAALRTEGGEMITFMREGQNQAKGFWSAEIEQLKERVTQAIAEISRTDEAAIGNARKRLELLSEAVAKTDVSIAASADAFETDFAQRRQAHEAAQADAIAALEQQIAAFDRQMTERQEDHLSHISGLAERGEGLAARLQDIDREMARLAQQGQHEGAQLTAKTELLSEKVSQSRAILEESSTFVSRLTDDSVRLLEIIRSTSDHSAGALSDSIGAAEARLKQFEVATIALRDIISEAEAKGSALAGHVSQTSDKSGAAIELAYVLEARLSAVAEQAGQLAREAQGELKDAIAVLEEAATQTLERLRTDQAEAVRDIANDIGSQGVAALEQALRDGTSSAIAEVELAARNAGEQGHAAATNLRNQLAKVNELAGNLEQRVAQARAHAEEQVDGDFSRRMALITESLNSSAIDISRAIDTEVSDTAWASYLRGDRGVFTRRAVRLLDNREARGVSDVYESDAEVREAINRYIHDFEAMLRTVLSTRDGNVLAVTLLSSDMGKLYVALAQAIERLRD